MDALDQVAGWPVPHASVGLVGFGPTPDGPAGTGLQPLGVVGSADRAYRWASVTKPVTALTVLVACEEGTVSLDDPAGPPGATVRHLLAHASGLGPEPDSPTVAPGVRRIYSNAGYLVLARLVAERAGMPFADYCSQAVLEPLGMAGTGFDPAAPSGAAAAGLSGPLDDLLALGRELAAPTLVSAQTHQAAVSVQYPGLDGVLPGFGRFEPCDWGLGVEIRGDKRPHWTGTDNSPETFGHFGQSGSFLWIDPSAGLIAAGLGDRAFGPWAARAWPRLADAALAEWAGGGDRRAAGGSHV
jgi:CubicO group peptidase (beta-lactamase class C family)